MYDNGGAMKAELIFVGASVGETSRRLLGCTVGVKKSLLGVDSMVSRGERLCSFESKASIGAACVRSFVPGEVACR